MCCVLGLLVLRFGWFYEVARLMHLNLCCLLLRLRPRWVMVLVGCCDFEVLLTWYFDACVWVCMLRFVVYDFGWFCVKLLNVYGFVA